MILLFIMPTLFRTIYPLQAEEEKLFLKTDFIKATRIILQICVKGVGLLSITTLIRATHILLQDGTLERTRCYYEYFCNQDCYLTRYKHRLDDLPNLRIHRYYTWERALRLLSIRIWLNKKLLLLQSGWRTGYNNSAY